MVQRHCEWLERTFDLILPPTLLAFALSRAPAERIRFDMARAHQFRRDGALDQHFDNKVRFKGNHDGVLLVWRQPQCGV
jgi:hypothetical protein